MGATRPAEGLPRSTGMPRPPFVGRSRELALLRERLAAAVQGHGGVTLLLGEPGIGKTRLAEELGAAAEAQGARVLWGRCWEGEGAPAFWPWVQCLRSYARDTAADVLRADLGASRTGAGAVPLLRCRHGLPDGGRRAPATPGHPRRPPLGGQAVAAP